MSNEQEERAYSKLGRDLVELMRAAFSKYEGRLSEVEKENKFMREQMYYLMTRLDLKDLIKREDEFNAH